MMNIAKNTLLKLNNIFFYSIINPIVRDEIGFKSISGLCKDRGWYIWLNQWAGVYDLFSLSCENENSINFLLKYYPSPNESIFEMYSLQEKALRNQYSFDQGVPKQDIRDNDLVDYFNIGRLDILWEDHLIWLHLVTSEDDNNTEKSDVPQLQLSYSLFTHLIRAICLFTKTPPSLFLTRKTCIPQSIDSPDIKFFEAKSTIIRQFSCALLPNVSDKGNDISELCNSIGVNQTSRKETSLSNGVWEPLYIEDHKKRLPTFSHLLDKKWWTLPEKANTILTKELAI